MVALNPTGFLDISIQEIFLLFASMCLTVKEIHLTNKCGYLLLIGLFSSKSPSAHEQDALEMLQCSVLEENKI